MRLITLTAITGAGEDMFDEYLDSQTETAEEISKTFSILGFNAVVVLNTYGISASLTIGAETQTVSLIRDSTKDWWDYWFAPSRIGKDCIFYFPTPAVATNATLTISYPGGTAKCGMCITGKAAEIMNTRWGVEIGITDYSKISTDGFGQTYLNVGSWARRASADLHLDSNTTDVAYREIIKNRATPCIFDYNQYTQSLSDYHTSDNGIQALIVYGYTEDFYISIAGPTISLARHESQGLR